MITVHHLDNSRSHRILWLLEELELPYELVLHRRDKATLLAPRELREIHPLGKAPVLVDGRHTFAESGAIISYLISAYGAGRLVPPEGSDDRLRYEFWLHHAEGSAMPPLLLKLVFDMLPQRVPSLLRPIVRKVASSVQEALVIPQLARLGDYWDSELSRSHWFAGSDFTAADIQMSFPMEAFAARSGMAARYQHIAAFRERTHSRPAYKQALLRGGPISLS